MFGLTIETTGSSTAQPMVGRVEASKRATCAADHLRATLEPRTEGGRRGEMWLQAAQVAYAAAHRGAGQQEVLGLFRVTEERPTPTNPHPIMVRRASVQPRRTWRSARAVRPPLLSAHLRSGFRSLLRKKRVISKFLQVYSITLRNTRYKYQVAVPSAAQCNLHCTWHRYRDSRGKIPRVLENTRCHLELTVSIPYS